MYVVIRDNEDGTLFDYANNQKLVYELHEKLSKVIQSINSQQTFSREEDF